MAKASGLIACVQLFQLSFGLLRNKFIALLIGASGFGVWSLYQTFTEMIASFSVLGLDQGGIREIAKNPGNEEKTGKCIFTFRITILFLSIISSIIIFILSSRISLYIFNSEEYAFGIKVLSITIIFSGISKGGYAILNGVRALKYLTFSQIIAAVSGCLSAILIVYLLRLKGVAIAFSAVTVTAAIFTVFYINKLRIKIYIPSFKEFRNYLKKLLYLGIGFTAAGLAATTMTLLSRRFLSSHYSLELTGIYQASWTISNLYIGIILTAMGIDLMPRLSQISANNAKMNRLVNQQIEFGICIASVGAALILIFSSFILNLLYSAEFVPGASIIRWQVPGVLMRVVAFPFGYAMMAKNKPLQYAFVQAIFWTLDYILLTIFSGLWGFQALGGNYCIAYLIYLILTYCACRHNQGFRFSTSSKRIIVFTGTLILFYCLLSRYLTGLSLYTLSGLLFLLQIRWTNKVLEKQMGIGIASYIKNKLLNYRH